MTPRGKKGRGGREEKRKDLTNVFYQLLCSGTGSDWCVVTSFHSRLTVFRCSLIPPPAGAAPSHEDIKADLHPGEHAHLSITRPFAQV